ncbi:MAG TPA: hypothetical protein VFZ61_34620, partial [Polyangiales bacterium]
RGQRPGCGAVDQQGAQAKPGTASNASALESLSHCSNPSWLAFLERFLLITKRNKVNLILFG